MTCRRGYHPKQCGPVPGRDDACMCGCEADNIFCDGYVSEETIRTTELNNYLHMIDYRKTVQFRYENHAGKTELRWVLPLRVFWGHTEYYPEDQWLLEAFDLRRKAVRTFAMYKVPCWQVADKSSVVEDNIR
jgi:hypothetical protein